MRDGVLLPGTAFLVPARSWSSVAASADSMPDSLRRVHLFLEIVALKIAEI